jgi:hypothetical protein
VLGVAAVWLLLNRSLYAIKHGNGAITANQTRFCDSKGCLIVDMLIINRITESDLKA